MNPPQFNWKRHILFFEDIQIDVEDLHRTAGGPKRHGVFKEIRGIVIGSLSGLRGNITYRKHQKEALKFVRTYLADVIRSEAEKGGHPLPILAVSNFGHNIERNVMAVPIGGYVSISRAGRSSSGCTSRSGPLTRFPGSQP